jgi:predicted nicotinamide N-methyase
VLRPPTLESGAGTIPASSGRKRKGPKGKSEKEEVRLPVRVQQDLTALKGRKGDTGSSCVLDPILAVSDAQAVCYGGAGTIRIDLPLDRISLSSLYLARHILTQHHYPSPNPLINLEVLQRSRVLELGAGTGLLAVLLSPLCAEYTASDRLENLKLVHRNLELNGLAPRSSSLPSPSASTGKSKRKDPGKAAGVIATQRTVLEEIDWVAVSDQRLRAEARSPTKTLRPLPSSPTLAKTPLSPHRTAQSLSGHIDSSGGDMGDIRSDEYDLVLAVDCIYNENLVKPLVDTLNAYCPPGGNTVVWVVVELRSSDVVSGLALSAHSQN